MEVGCYNHLSILVPYMNRFNNILPLLASLLLYAILWFVMGPVLGYNLDSDCVAYLTIAKRMANGEYLGSINGLWSPLNSALLAIFIRMGFDAWEMAKILNCIFGAIVLIQSFFLFRFFAVKRNFLWLLLPSLAVAMVQFVYFQMFGDILQLIFVLFYLFVVLVKREEGIGIGQGIFGGIIMGLAFYAKAYSFFFFVMHFMATLFWFVYQQRMLWRKAMVVYLVGICAAIAIIVPWTIALHQKYHVWSLNGFAGKLNMSWYINSGKSFHSSIKLLIPPTYSDSPSFWEDPYLTQGPLDGPFTSTHHFVKWVMRVVHTLIVCIFCFQEISFLGLALCLIALFYYFFYHKKRGATNQHFQAQLLIITIFVLPLGYVMMHIETRYIWLNVPLLMLLGALILQEEAFAISSKFVRQCLQLIVAFSFLIFPIYQMENLKYKNKDLFETAERLNADSIRGRFTSNTNDAGRMWVIAYLTGSTYYTIEKSEYSPAELRSEMKRYQVKYYFFESGNGSPEIEMISMKKNGKYGGIEVFETTYN